MRVDHRSGRLAGALYLVVVLTGIFTLAYVPTQIPVYGDPAVALDNIRASAPLYRMGIAAFLVMQVSFLLLPLALFPLLRPAGPAAATMMVAFVAVSVPVALVSLSGRLEALALATDAQHAARLQPERLHAALQAALAGYQHRLLITRLFWGLWLLPLGYLILRAGLLPGVLGGLLVLGGFGYIVDVFGELLVPGYADGMLARFATRPASVGEIGTCLWLLVAGARSPRRVRTRGPDGGRAARTPGAARRNDVQAG